MPIELNLKGAFYPIYKAANSSFSDDTFRCAEETVVKLLETVTTSDNPGMLLGKVQSGKTRAFISILALAFDNGYDIAIVLSKNSIALLEQTTKRLNSEFNHFCARRELEVYDIMNARSSFTEYQLNSKMIFTAKKQKHNLKRLQDLFEKDSLIAGKRILIIDDEADNASVGYSKKKGLIEANTIARQISELRSVLITSSFLQVTATPYSLYLQPNEVEVANVLAFKPTRPAFTALVPVPADYVGGETYFGESSRSETDTLESLIHHIVDPKEFDRLKKQDLRSFKLSDVLETPLIVGYRSAMVNFIVGGCIQRINGVEAGGNERLLRYSFLVHSEAGKPAHRWQEKLTTAIVSGLKVACEQELPILEDLIKLAYEDLSRSLAIDSKPIPVFTKVLTEVKESLLGGHVSIMVANSDEEVAKMLDSTGQLDLPTPLNIFIGGQVLDRGVTLASMIGFYYGRRPKRYQQDTVLQHSRMYGYRREDLAVTRFYTSKAIRSAMTQMDEFDTTLRAAIYAGGDRGIQFIRKAADGSIVPCSPNKILASTTQTLRPGKRILPIGFQSGYRTGVNGIENAILAIDSKVDKLCNFNTAAPETVSLKTALDLLDLIKPTLKFTDDDTPPFDWDAAAAALTHLSQQHTDPAERGKVLLWAARDRNSSRMASEGSNAKYIETPDSQKTEGVLANRFATDHPILFLLRQNGESSKGWRDTPFYWPVIRAQQKTKTAIYAADTIE